MRGAGTAAGRARARRLGWAGFSRYQGRAVRGRSLSEVRSDSAPPALVLRAAPGGLSRSLGPCDRALTWGGRAGGRREPGPGLRSAPRPLLPGLRGLRAQPVLRLQQRLDTEGQRAGPRAVPATGPEPRRVHDERRRGHAQASGRGACRPGGRVAGAARRATAWDSEATPPSVPYKKAVSFS